MSLAWYTALEQGRAVGVSDDAIRRVANALCLRPVERRYLLRLLRNDLLTAPDRPLEEVITPSLQRMLDSMSPTPAYVMNWQWDVLAFNASHALLVPDLAHVGASGVVGAGNMVRFIFTNLDWRRQTAEWERHARECLAGFRFSYAEDPSDPRARSLIRELSSASPEFRRWWQRHEVAARMHHAPQVHEHPIAGQLTLQTTLVQLRGGPRLVLALRTPADDESASKLRRLIESGAK